MFAPINSKHSRLNASLPPLRGQIKMKAAIAGARARAAGAPWADDLVDSLDGFYDLKEVARVFATIWDSRKYSIRSGIALRALVQASAEVARRVWKTGGDPCPVVRSLLAPWADRIGDARFETAGAWRAQAAGGGKETTRILAREVVAALGTAPAKAVTA
jgi:hypothetical protein